MGRILAVVLLLIVGLAPRPAAAAPILGGTIIVAGTDDVIATYLGQDAGFTHDLYLFSTDDPAFVPLWLFNTGDPTLDPAAEGGPGSTPMDQVNLGSFAPGTELVFRLRVNPNDGPDYDLFTGSGGANPDGEPKAFVDSAFACPHAYLSINPADPVDPLCLLAAATVVGLGGAQTVVGWEDLLISHPSYDGDFNDLVFAFSNTRAAVDEAPEPTSLLLLGLGAAGLAARRRRQQKTL